MSKPSTFTDYGYWNPLKRQSNVTKIIAKNFRVIDNPTAKYKYIVCNWREKCYKKVLEAKIAFYISCISFYCLSDQFDN